MPYEITFKPKIEAANEEDQPPAQNWLGNVFLERIMPTLKAKFTDIEERIDPWDWDIYAENVYADHSFLVSCEEMDDGQFRVRIFSFIKRWLGFTKMKDIAELQALTESLAKEIGTWSEALKVTHMDNDFTREV